MHLRYLIAKRCFFSFSGPTAYWLLPTVWGTAGETNWLTMFARLRGIPESVIKATVESEIRRVDLVQHADKLCGKYR